MKYVSIDIETTGLDEKENQIIEFGAIIEDSNNPKSYEESKKYRRIVLNPDRKYTFSSYAAKINAGLIATISDIENGINVSFDNNPNLTQAALFDDDLIKDFKTWLLFNGFKENSKGIVEIVAAGKNFASFDKKFIDTLATDPYSSSRIKGIEWYGLKFHYRSLDPTALFIHWDTDEAPPSTDVCKKRANLRGQVKHEALSDAWDVIELLRLRYLPVEAAIVPTAVAV